MNSIDSQLTQMVSLFAAQVPVLIVSVLACMVIMTRKNDLGGATMWGLAGFGLSIALCVLIPVVQVLVQKWIMEGGSTGAAQRASVFTILAIVWSILRAASLAMLLMAIVAGRRAGGTTAASSQ